MHNVQETVQWYRTHETRSQLGFGPNGMCLKICRTARDLPALYPSAVAAQVATPKQFREYDIADIRRGMVGYFDDPNDSNPFGHIVTWVGRIKGVDPSKLSSLLCRTNSVVSDEIVVVRGDYFPTHWGDQFQFAATWLNGQELEMGTKPPAPKPPPRPKTPRLQHAIEDLEAARSFHFKEGHDRIVRALTRDIKELQETLRNISGGTA